MSAGELLLRDARPGERAAIGRLTLRAYEEYASIMAPGAWRALRDAVHASLADDAPMTRIVAERGGALVGSVALYAPGSAPYGDLASRSPWPEVRLVAVDPAKRGTGVGRALVLECIRRAQRAGATMLGLHTSRSMHAATRLYERLGFARDPDRDFHPPGAELVEGYVLRLNDSAQHQEP
jgi:GNAT superfamily N-acetyltransferase